MGNAFGPNPAVELEKVKQYEYIELPYRLGLITATGPNAISAVCKK
ncbi:hypothetical protein [Pelomonas sp. Root1217]|nr:hypothetical protein [Pelomonas sp. Root1217]